MINRLKTRLNFLEIQLLTSDEYRRGQIDILKEVIKTMENYDIKEIPEKRKEEILHLSKYVDQELRKLSE